MIGRRTWSIRLRMTLLTATVTAVFCVAVSVLLIAFSRARTDDYEREQTISAALSVVHLIKRDRLPTELHHGTTPVLQVIDARGRVAAGSDAVRGDPRIAWFEPNEESVYAARTLCPSASINTGFDACMNVIAFRVYEPDGDWTVYAAEQVVPWYVSGELVGLAAAVGLLLVAVVAALTWRTVSRTLAPVNDIRGELAEITARSSGHRVPVPRGRDEIRDLAETVNATLDRLDAALEQQRRFTSDASHDLRSPITAARAQVEEALMAPDEADWPGVGHEVLGSLERLQAIVTDLLELARLDAGTAAQHEPVDLSSLVAIELGRVERHVRVVPLLTAGVTVDGDRHRLARLLTNLLDNAERHAVKTVEVEVRVDAGHAVLEVRDDGAGIAPADRETVFQRFARLKASRDRDAGGTGLGLPIARQIARGHGGSLTIEDCPRGARFVLRLPLLRQRS